MYYSVRALVLRSQVSGEADKLVTLYTREWGKVTAIVPGAKKIKAKFSALSEPVMESDLMVYLAHPTARPKVTGGRILNGFAYLRTDWRRFSVAQHCAEISDVMTPFNAENEKKYELLLRAWELLATANNPSRILTAFMLRFLRLSGYSFTEYLRQEANAVPRADRALIERLSALSGEEADTDPAFSAASDRDLRRHVEAYIAQYLPRPVAAREFWHKVSLAHERQRRSRVHERVVHAST